MEKSIKKEVVKNIREPWGTFASLISDYRESVADTEKETILVYFIEKKLSYWRVMRILNRQGFYLERTTFYRIKDEIITDIALRACYEHLICPYGDKSQPNKNNVSRGTQKKG